MIKTIKDLDILTNGDKILLQCPNTKRWHALNIEQMYPTNKTNEYKIKNKWYTVFIHPVGLGYASIFTLREFKECVDANRFYILMGTSYKMLKYTRVFNIIG